MAAVIISATLCGCADEAPKETELQSTENTVTTEDSVQTSAVFETEAQTGVLPPVSYPCNYSSEELHCTYDDTDIFGTLYLPKNYRDKHPTIILSHGFNCIGKDMCDVAMAFAENGIMTYTYDFCGGGTRSASSGSTEEMSVTSEQDNLRHVIDMISEMDSCDSSKLYLYGESQGGFVSALTGAEMPDRIAGMFLVYPAFSIVDDLSSKNSDTMTEPFNFMGVTLSRSFYDGLPDFDVYERIGNFTNYVHIYQGDNDYAVNVSYAEKIDGIFPDSELTIVEGAGHVFGGKDRQMVKDSVCGYFADNNFVD